ncbi:rho GTPase-activating protein 30 [Tachyglossus aculeatus]|uniref:rho GTPase-activating protein 30 n=1 Tax=Tachyglossus aculeatus TaxID=9261 RepID=UPI0018F6BDF0|nr:rho GTPase-activating protein 30 [Tachyglossus aculeatus]
MKSRQKGKKKGGSKERVFGCDLLEHLQNSGQDVPQVLRSCAEFVEEHGVVDGIYRLSGVSSNIQRLRQEFEAERKPDLGKEVYLQDIHCVSSLCKAYFRELPDPLLTYRLYDKFAEAVAVQMEAERLVKIGEVLRELPDPHYRTLEFLMRHLVHMASFSGQTNMHARNLAIVWAPNLLRSKDIEASGFNGTAAFMEVRVQSIVVEFVLTHVQQLFGGAPLPIGEAEGGRRSLLLGIGRPPIGPGVLEEVSSRSPTCHLPSILQAGDGPPQMRPYHTIIEIGDHKRKGSLKVRKWRSIFNLGRSGHETKRKTHRGGKDGEKLDKGSLRPAKSMDSLSAACGVCDESEEPPRSDGPRPSLLGLDGPEDVSAAAAAAASGFPEAGGETSSAPGTPRAGRAGVRSPSSRAERCAGVHISDPYNVNLPLHITSMLSGPPTIVSNVSLARLTRGLECPALLPRPANAANVANADEAENAANVANADEAENAASADKAENAANADEKAEASPAPAEAAGPELARLSQEVQDSFSFLEDLNGSEKDWGGGEGQGVCPRPLSLVDDDPVYLGDPFYTGAGLQAEEFSVEPPLDELSLDEAPFVLAPACCSLDGRAPTPEESGDDVFLSAYDDLSPLLGPGAPGDEARWAPNEAWGRGEAQEDAGAGGRRARGDERTGEAAGAEGEEPGGDGEARVEAGDPGAAQTRAQADPEVRGEEVNVEALGLQEGDGPRDGPEVQEEAEGGWEILEEAEGGWEVREEARTGQEVPGEAAGGRKVQGEAEGEGWVVPEEAGESQEVQKETGRGQEVQEEDGGGREVQGEARRGQKGQEEVRGGQEVQEEAGGGQEVQEEATGGQQFQGGVGEGQEAPEEARGSQEVQAEAGKEMEPERIQASDPGDPEARGEEAEGDGEATRAREAEGGREAGENGPLAPGAEPLAASGSEPAGPGYQRPAPSERWPPCPSPPPPSPTGSVGMRLASTLVRVQQVRSVPVIPPKPQFAKVPCALTSKIHVAPATPCPRPGRLDGSPAEGASAARAQRASWRNGGSLSFDAAVALARERQRTQAPAAVRRTQTCGPPPPPCGPVPPCAPRPLSCVGCPLTRDPPLGGSERADPRSRLSLPPPASRPPETPGPRQRSSYAFERPSCERRDGRDFGDPGSCSPVRDDSRLGGAGVDSGGTEPLRKGF